MENVNLSVVLQYKLKGALHKVLDSYDDAEQAEDVSETDFL